MSNKYLNHLGKKAELTLPSISAKAKKLKLPKVDSNSSQTTGAKVIPKTRFEDTTSSKKTAVRPPQIRVK